MQLVIIGATGGIGRALLEQGKQRGHRVTALVRAPDKLGPLAEGVSVIRGNPLDPEVVKEVLTLRSVDAGHVRPPPSVIAVTNETAPR